jgi:CRP-like cAMP-binding protein
LATEGLAAFVNPGMVFGLQGFRYGLHERSAEYKLECRALIDSEFCAIPASVAADGLRTDPTVAETITRSLLNRIQDNQLLLAFASSADAERRLIAIVWMLATRMGIQQDGGLLVHGLSHEDLARLMSSTRPTVTRLLARLEQRNLLRLQRRSILVPDADALIKLLD